MPSLSLSTTTMNPTKLWKKFRSRRSSDKASGTASIGQTPSPAGSSARSSTVDRSLDSAAHATGSLALDTVGSQLPSQSQGKLSLSPSSAPILAHPTIFSDAGSNTPRSKPGLAATAYSGTKLVLDVAKETADVFPPLKSALGGLTALLKHYDVSAI